MIIDIVTMLVILTMVCGTVGLIFTLAAFGQPDSSLAGRLGAASLLCAAGVLLIVLRDQIPDRVSIDLANALVVLGLGFAWSAARNFWGRRAPLAIVGGGAAIWLLACTIPAFHGEIIYRVALTSTLGAAYCFAAAAEFLRPTEQPLQTRWPIAFLCVAHATVLVARAFYWLSGAAGQSVFEGDLFRGLLTAEPILVLVALSFLGILLDRERAENVLRATAETDWLTGILGRGAMISRSARALAGAAKARQPCTLLLFDLDHFKSINDRFGHSTGDRIIRTFTDIASAGIRGTDLIGRIGGEEFAALLVGADAIVGRAIAERIRIAFARASKIQTLRVPATVSIGVAEAVPGLPVAFEDLLMRADQALYQAKRAGRDQVVSALALAS